MRIVIATDAWAPQVNGVVNTLMATRERLQRLGHEVLVLSAEGMRTFSCPTYPEIRLACRPYRQVAQAIDAFAPDCIHIATEGPIGLATRRYCLRQGLRFTTSYHTRFPEYIRARTMLPLGLTYLWLRWFHEPSSTVMVSTPTLMHGLAQRGFDKLALWGRGVDTGCFKPETCDHAGIERPLYLYVGRLAVEKNIEAFLQMGLPGTKWVIGDGPQREELEKRYPSVHFLGARPHDSLAHYYNCADVVVFPSLTDTFGLVILEAMACGVPVAAFPVAGPADVVEQGKTGILDQDIERACFEALRLPREQVRQHALKHSWEAATRQFLRNLRPAAKTRPATAFPPSVLHLGDLSETSAV
jgi:glycosyltransferase involved in cell wall biosynthesis